MMLDFRDAADWPIRESGSGPGRGAAFGLVIDAALTLVKKKIEPKGLCYRDLGPWPVPAGTDQRRIEHPII